MKIKISKIFNDYLIDVKKYYRITKKKIRKIYRELKYHWNNPKSKVGKIVIPKVSLFFNRIYMAIDPYFNAFKESLLKSDNRRRNLTVIGVFIILNLLFLISLPSFAIYLDQYEFPVLGGVVGDKYANQFDYSLLIYIEDVNESGNGSGTYNLTSDIPTLGYTYKGYNCKNDSTLIYDEVTKNTSVTIDKKDICSIYFDLNSSDISLKIMLEDAENSNTYTLANKLPYYGYKYSHYECENNSVLNYDSELHKVSIEAGNKDSCSIYFKKEAVISDIEINLFVENTHQSSDYEEKITIPSGNTYVLNENNSECLNANNERIETEISYMDGYIEITTKEQAYCEVYLDLANE